MKTLQNYKYIRLGTKLTKNNFKNKQHCKKINKHIKKTLINT